MLFHPYSGRLIIADYSEGLMVWDTKSERMIYTWDRPVNSRISSLRTLDDRNVLVATDGEGLYRMDIINPEIRSLYIPILRMVIQFVRTGLSICLWMIRNISGWRIIRKAYQ